MAGTEAEHHGRAVLGCFVLFLLGAGVCTWMIGRLGGSSRYGTDSPHSGWSARWVGDVDADGTPDFVLSTPFAPGATVPRVFSGATGKSLDARGARRVIWEGRAYPGDLDGDGSLESWWDDGNGIHLMSDGTRGLGRTFACDLSGLLDVLDDLDGDGTLDLLIGGYPARGRETNRVSAVSARTGAVIWTMERAANQTPGDTPFAWIGCVVGDIDLDGIADAAVQDGRERVEFLSGRNGATIGRAESRCDWVTGSLSPLGDLDGNGRPDLLIHGGHGAPTEAVSCVDGRVLAAIALPRYAYDVFSPGDVDGDGKRDVAWSSSEGGACASALDGSFLGRWSGVRLLPGDADHDRDGHADLLAVRNVSIEGEATEPDDLWRLGRIEIISGKSLTVTRVFDANALGLPR